MQENDLNKIDEYFPQLTPEQRDALRKYYDRLLYINKKINLIASSTVSTLVKQHFADAVMGLEICLKHRQFDAPVYDFGSGNGLPGLVLAILKPELAIHLVERDQRKSEALKYMASELKLSNVTVHASNIEDLDKSVVTLGVTRALGSLAQVLIHVNSVYTKGGVLYHFKTDNWTSELAKAPTQLFNHWDIQSVGRYVLPESTISRHIIATTRL